MTVVVIVIVVVVVVVAVVLVVLINSRVSIHTSVVHCMLLVETF